MRGRCVKCGMILDIKDIEPRSQMCWCCYAEDNFKQQNKQIEICKSTGKKYIINKIRQYDLKTNKQETSYTEYVIGLCELLDELEKELEEQDVTNN